MKTKRDWRFFGKAVIILSSVKTLLNNGIIIWNLDPFHELINIFFLSKTNAMDKVEVS